MTSSASTPITANDLASARAVWTDPARAPEERVGALLSVMTLGEKLAQLGSTWLEEDDQREDGASNVAPMQEVFGQSETWDQVAPVGVGHLTRVFGTQPVSVADGVARLRRLQQELVARGRLGLPAIAHEECLTGFATFGATIYPTPLALAATFDPDLVAEVTGRIGRDLRAVDVHQGLAPVLDVVRDLRWGRVEETMGEDPYLVGVIGSAYVRGLESAGVVATLKHFAGYSASRAARNHAPVPMGPRELADVLLVPFEMALRLGGARSVMTSYADVDGLPPTADPALVTGLLRVGWGFDGTVVSDYWAISFLINNQRIAATQADAAALALAAGVDVELPERRCYGDDDFEARVAAGEVDETLVDRSVARVLHQKLQLGLLDAGWQPQGDDRADLDAPANRALARAAAQQSIVLLHNDGTLPLTGDAQRVAVVGPCADDPLAFLGCYSYPNHVLPRYPDRGLGVEVPSLLDALRSALPAADIAHAAGCPVEQIDTSGIAPAAELVAQADVAILVIGDRAGLFGRGTSGEGNDVEDLRLPGAQADLVDAVLSTGTPVVAVVVSGRPYALGDVAGRAAAAVQAFMPGEEAGAAIAGVLSGSVAPTGRLPVQIPASPGGQPATYLHPQLGEPGLGISAADTIVSYPFGHGLTYTSFAYRDLQLAPARIGTDGETRIACTVVNTGDRAGTEVVQLYVDDPIAEVPRPVRQLAGFTRVTLDPGGAARVVFTLHADRLAYTGRNLRRIVDAGEIRVMVGSSSAHTPLIAALQVEGATRTVGPDRALTTPVEATPLS
jgi:beta-xylosidase